MKYNIEYIDLQYNLINCLLVKIESNILDVSYDVNGNQLIIQIIYLKNTFLSEKLIKNLREILPKYEITIKKIPILKEEFNENIDEWLPIHYEWLNNLLFSKAEII